MLRSINTTIARHYFMFKKDKMITAVSLPLILAAGNSMASDQIASEAISKIAEANISIDHLGRPQLDGKLAANFPTSDSVHAESLDTNNACIIINK